MVEKAMSSAAIESILGVNNGSYAGRDPAEAALLARILRYFDNAVRALPKKDQARALAAPDDFWTLMEMLALAPAIGCWTTTTLHYCECFQAWT